MWDAINEYKCGGYVAAEGTIKMLNPVIKSLGGGIVTLTGH